MNSTLMNYKIISSGSTGNAVLINDILIDCGVPYKKLTDVSSTIKLVLLTHEHSDHYRLCTLEHLMCANPAIRIGCPVHMLNKIQDSISSRNIDVLESGKKYDYRRFTVEPISLYHNVPNYGYRLHCGTIKAIYATDTGTLDGLCAKNYDYYFIEANYDEDLLLANINASGAKGEYNHQKAALKNHLSLQQCVDFYSKNAGRNSTLIKLHQHKEWGGVTLW